MSKNIYQGSFQHAISEAEITKGKTVSWASRIGEAWCEKISDEDVRYVTNMFYEVSSVQALNIFVTHLTTNGLTDAGLE
jgi:hypothetical protein